MKRFLSSISLVALLTSPGFAGSGTITTTDASSVTRTFDVITDGSGNFVSETGICDQSAAAYCATVTSSNALKVDGSAVTQPISASALPLPTGAATAAKQPALGTAGSASSDVITIQGIASMTALTVSGTVTANAGTNLNTSALALESGGNLATIAGAITSSVVQSNTKQVNGVTTSTGAGAVGTGSQRVAVGEDTNTIAGSAPGTAGSASSNVVTVQGIASMTALKVDGSGVTQPVSGTITANAGTNLNTSALALESGGNLATIAGAITSSVVQSNTKQVNGVTTSTGAGAVGTGSQRVAVGEDTNTIAGSAPGTAGSASSNVLSVQGVSSMTPLNVINTPSSASGNALSHASVTSLGTSLVAKASAGNLYGFNCTGVAGAGAGYCIAYNATSAPSTGALTGANVLDSCYFDTTARGCSLSHVHAGINFSSGIVILMTSATTPFTYTTGTDTGFIEVDYE